MTAHAWSLSAALYGPKAAEAPQPAAWYTPAPVVESGYAATALARETATVAATAQGRRNDQLNIAAFNLGQLVPLGLLSEDTITEALTGAALAAGLPLTEIRHTLRSGLRDGIERPRHIRPLGEVVEVATLGPAPDAAEAAEGDPEPRERTSWWPLPLAEQRAASDAAPVPTHLFRTDGKALLYPARINGLIGESESGKSWVELVAIAQALAAGEAVLLLDFEDTAGGISGRLGALGVAETDLARLDYAAPDEALGLAQGVDLAEALRKGYGLIALDGVNAAMTLLGYDLTSNTDATAFFQRVLRPLAAQGSCVVTVDHVPKNPELRGKGGIGAQAKRAMMSGACIVVEVVEPFGKGQSGKLRLKVDKDRPGVVRGISAGSTLAGYAAITSIGETVQIAIEPPDGAPGATPAPAFRPTGLMEKISRHLEDVDAAEPANQTAAAVGGKRSTVTLALGLLVAEGYLERTDGPRNATLHRSLVAYRQADDSTSDMYAGAQTDPPYPPFPTVSPPFPGNSERLFPSLPPPYGGGKQSRSPGHDQHLATVSRDGTSDCNQCGEPTPDAVIDETGGYCRRCGWAR